MEQLEHISSSNREPNMMVLKLKTISKNSKAPQALRPTKRHHQQCQKMGQVKTKTMKALHLRWQKRKRRWSY